MNRYANWSDFLRDHVKIPDISDKLADDNIQFKMWFHQFDGFQAKLPTGIHEIAERVETGINRAYRKTKIRTFESPDKVYKKEERLRYSSFIYGTENSHVILHGYMMAWKLSQNIPAALGMNCTLPTDGFQEQTNEFLTNLWPEIRGCEYAEPNKKYQGNTNFGVGHILLVDSGITIATGLEAFSAIGMQLPAKKIDLVGGYEA